jgi:tRNA(Arg) A34 adenosine deaminase TadA
MNSYVKLAIQQAESSVLQYRMGAVLVKGKTVIGAGCNRNDHPKLRRWRSRHLFPHTGLHAEMAALWGCDWKALPGTRLYVVRVKRDGSLAMAKPCKVCEELIGWAGIRKVYYSNLTGKIEMMK